MLSAIKCKFCGEENLLVDKGFPLYYFGAGPNNPEDANLYFCGPGCAWDYKLSKNVQKNG